MHYTFKTTLIITYFGNVTNLKVNFIIFGFVCKLAENIVDYT